VNAMRESGGPVRNTLEILIGAKTDLERTVIGTKTVITIGTVIETETVITIGIETETVITIGTETETVITIETEIGIGIMTQIVAVTAFGIETKNTVIEAVPIEMAIIEIEIDRLEGMDEAIVTIESVVGKETRGAVGLHAVPIIMEGAVLEMGGGFKNVELAEVPIFRTF